MDTVGSEKLDVRVINERNSVHVDDPEVRGVSLDFANVDHFINILFPFAGQLKSTWKYSQCMVNLVAGV